MDREVDKLLFDIHDKALRLIVVCSDAGTTRGRDLAGEICTMAATYRQGKRMQEESTAPDRYDLNALPAPVAIDSEDDTESPDFED